MIVDETGNVSCHIQPNVPASMKENFHATEIVATSKKLFCCKFPCQCGCQRTEQVVCVHILEWLFLVSVLLHDNSTENALLGLNASLIWSNWILPMRIMNNGCIEEQIVDAEKTYGPYP